MKRLFFIALAMLGVGCGAPLCQDAGAANAFVAGCTHNGASASYCGCAFEYLADRYACHDFPNATVKVLTDACRACGGSGC